MMPAGLVKDVQTPAEPAFTWLCVISVHIQASRAFIDLSVLTCLMSVWGLMHLSPFGLPEEECNWEQHAGAESVRESASQPAVASDTGQGRRKMSGTASKAAKAVSQSWPVSR